MNTNVQISYNPLQGILNILGIVGMWKIFEDRGEKGWKAIIPFYSDYVFGKVCDETKLGKKVVIWEVTTIILLFVVFFALSFSLASSGSLEQIQEIIATLEANPNAVITPDMMANNNLTLSNPVPFLISLLLFVIAIIFLFVYIIKLRYRFTVKNNGQTWLMILWILIPAIALLYFAFIHKDIYRVGDDINY